MGELVSGILGFAGQRQSNEIQQEDFLSNQQFNASQAAINRDWMTEMSDTAMQRRVDDLKAAGLNPLLAIAQGGASQPGASAASSGGIPNIQNPAAAGVSSALEAAQIQQSQASARAQDALATKTKSETPAPKTSGIDPVTGEVTAVAYPGHELGDATLNNIQANTGVARQEAVKIGALVSQIQSAIQNQNADTALKQIQTLLAGQNLTILQGTTSALISIANADGKMKGLEAEAFEKMSTAERNQYFGPVIGLLHSLMGPVATGVGVARGMGGFGGPSPSTATGGVFGNPDTVTGAPDMRR